LIFAEAVFTAEARRRESISLRFEEARRTSPDLLPTLG
jgi:hypothetical protein